MFVKRMDEKMTGMKVLVVEDDRPSRDFLVKTLQRQGYDVRSAEDGVVGLEVFKEYLPHLVFSDIRMPRMDGLELLKNIRRVSADAIVVMTTAFGSEEYTLQALRLKADDYLQKPLRFKDLMPLLKKYADVVENRTLESQVLGMVLYRHVKISFDNRFELIGKIADRMMVETGGAIPAAERLGVHLGLVELIANAIEHGNLEISYSEKTECLEKDPRGMEALFSSRLSDPRMSARKVVIEFSMDQEQCRWMITDEGKGFDVSSIPDPTKEENLFALHGRGIMLSRMKFDKLTYLGAGNQVEAVKYLKKSTPVQP